MKRFLQMQTGSSLISQDDVNGLQDFAEKAAARA
jgi:hypothetical protein